MRPKISTIAVVFTFVTAMLLTPVTADAEDLFPTFTDCNTVGLWLFDETQYPHTTLLDASEYEYDLRLLQAGRLVPGKFGNALSLSPSSDIAVCYAAWKGLVGVRHMREDDGNPNSGLWGPTVAPEKMLSALAGTNWTCEFWLKLTSATAGIRYRRL